MKLNGNQEKEGNCSQAVGQSEGLNLTPKIEYMPLYPLRMLINSTPHLTGPNSSIAAVPTPRCGKQPSVDRVGFTYDTTQTQVDRDIFRRGVRAVSLHTYIVL